jgi:aerobic carbon-monoxide dehydrogenase medium subunit
MISEEIEFCTPTKLVEALALLERYGDEAKILAGGMSLVPMMTLGLIRPKTVVSFNHIADLSFITDAKDLIRIGAMTRHETIARNELIKKHLPLLAAAASGIGDVQVRHRGTIGGSLAHADPAADYPLVMLVAGAQFRIQSSRADRMVKAADFFTGLMQTAVGAGEVLSEIHVPKLPAGAGSAYLRLHRIEGNFPIVNAAAVIEKGFKSARLALGGVGETAVMIDVTKHLSKGLGDSSLRAISDAAYDAAGEVYGDLNGDIEYRRAMARVYAQRAIKAAASQIN